MTTTRILWNCTPRVTLFATFGPRRPIFNKMPPQSEVPGLERCIPLYTLGVLAVL